VEMVHQVQMELEHMHDPHKGALVLHTNANDLRWLEQAGISPGEIEVFDIADVQRSWDMALNNKGLATMAREYGVVVDGKMHNGLNDAHTTREVFMAMKARRDQELEALRQSRLVSSSEGATKQCVHLYHRLDGSCETSLQSSVPATSMQTMPTDQSTPFEFIQQDRRFGLSKWDGDRAQGFDSQNETL
jgi:DNA polymerase III epsilon subunit-like protein